MTHFIPRLCEALSLFTFCAAIFVWAQVGAGL